MNKLQCGHFAMKSSFFSQTPRYFKIHFTILVFQSTWNKCILYPQHVIVRSVIGGDFSRIFLHWYYAGINNLCVHCIHPEFLQAAHNASDLCKALWNEVAKIVLETFFPLCNFLSLCLTPTFSCLKLSNGV